MKSCAIIPPQFKPERRRERKNLAGLYVEAFPVLAFRASQARLKDDLADRRNTCLLVVSVDARIESTEESLAQIAAKIGPYGRVCNAGQLGGCSDKLPSNVPRESPTKSVLLAFH